MRMLKSAGFAIVLMMSARLEATTVKTFANIEVKVASGEIEKKGAGIRTLYITLYDEVSQAPMPYGALKVDLVKDASGTVYKGVLDSSNLMVMGSGDPQKLRIKAKLDKDGSAGGDAPGDLVGAATGVTVGAKVTITIDKAI